MAQNKLFIPCQMTKTRNSFWSLYNPLSVGQHRATDPLKPCEKGIPVPNWQLDLHMSNLISPPEQGFSQHHLSRKEPAKCTRVGVKLPAGEKSSVKQKQGIDVGLSTLSLRNSVFWASSWCSPLICMQLYMWMCVGNYAGSSDLRCFLAEWRWHLTEKSKVFNNWQNITFAISWGIQLSIRLQRNWKVLFTNSRLGQHYFHK